MLPLVLAVYEVSWEAICLFGMVFPAIGEFTIYFIPESPSWYVTKVSIFKIMIFPFHFEIEPVLDLIVTHSVADLDSAFLGHPDPDPFKNGSGFFSAKLFYYYCHQLLK